MSERETDISCSPILPEFRRLHAFITLGDELHFRRAARRLQMTQSPLSRMIKGLERDLDLQLFTRTRRSVELTTAGQILLEETRRLIAKSNRAVRRVQRSESNSPPVDF